MYICIYAYAYEYAYVYVHIHISCYIVFLLSYTVILLPNTNNMLIIIGHRFGHQSGLEESSGHKSNIFRIQLCSTAI